MQTSITQIKEKEYPKGSKKYKDNLPIVGITYDSNKKTYML